jgi:glycosyltransferase involved in cell wall biosynthesis
MNRAKLIRITTVPISLEKLLEGQLTFMNEHFEVIAISSQKERLEKFGQENKVRTHYIELTRKITLLKDLKALWDMYIFLKAEKPLIVHSHTPKAGTIGMIAAKIARVPHRFHTVAGLPLLEETGAKRKLLNIVEKITYSCATKVYPNSNGLKKIIEELNYCKSNKLKVIGNGSSNGINTEYFNPEIIDEKAKIALQQKLKIEPSDFVFIFVGRIVKDKGINELVHAFESNFKDQKNVKLLLVGETEPELDPLFPSTTSIITENLNIITTGFIKDIRPFLSISNVMVFPSYREGFPNVILQACSMNIPCIVTNINGCNEIITNGVNGLIIPTKNISELVKSMHIMLNGKTEIMAYNSRPTILKKFEQKRVWEALLKEYNSIN